MSRFVMKLTVILFEVCLVNAAFLDLVFWSEPLASLSTLCLSAVLGFLDPVFWRATHSCTAPARLSADPQQLGLSASEAR